MPYIVKERRQYFAHKDGAIQTPGELNYLTTCLITRYIAENKLSYQTINDIIGALESCKLEFYRRVVVDYEDKKIKENGDCY